MVQRMMSLDTVLPFRVTQLWWVPGLPTMNLAQTLEMHIYMI